MKTVLFKIIFTIFVSLFFIACGSSGDGIDREKYIPADNSGTQNSNNGGGGSGNNPENNNNGSANGGSENQEGNGENPPPATAPSQILAPVATSFAEDIRFFNIREIDEPEQQPQQQNAVRKANDYGGQDNDDAEDTDENSDEDDSDDDDDDSSSNNNRDTDNAEDTDENSDEDDAKNDDDDTDDNNDDEGNDNEEEDEDNSNSNDSSTDNHNTTPSNTLQNFKTLGYINVTLQYKKYDFVVAQSNYANREMKPRLTPLANGKYFLSLTGYSIIEDSLDITYGVFTIEINNIDLNRESDWYPIEKNILTNSAVEPRMAYVTVDKKGDKVGLIITVERFLLYDRTKTQMYEAFFSVAATSEF